MSCLQSQQNTDAVLVGLYTSLCSCLILPLTVVSHQTSLECAVQWHSEIHQSAVICHVGVIVV